LRECAGTEEECDARDRSPPRGGQRNCERRYETDNTRLVGNTPEPQHSHRGQNGYLGTGARIRTLLEWSGYRTSERPFP